MDKNFEITKTAYSEFEQIRGNLLKERKFFGKYLALKGKEVVDHDVDEFILLERVLTSYPRDYIFIVKLSHSISVVDLPSIENMD